MKNSQDYSYPILFTFRRCPYAIRARMALAYSDITVNLREISLKNRPQALYETSSKGTVPVLCINSARIIDESLEIMIWALDQNDPDDWISHDKKYQIELIKLCDDEFKYWLDRYKYFDRFPENDRMYYREKCESYLYRINGLLRENRFIINDSLSLVDIAIFPFIRQFNNVDKYWLGKFYPGLSKWLSKLMASQLFLSVMHKYPENHENSLIVNFNDNN